MLVTCKKIDVQENFNHSHSNNAMFNMFAQNSAKHCLWAS